MRRLFWLFLILSGYIWMVTTENEQFVLEKGRYLYKIVSDWFVDADVDFQVEKKSTHKSPHRSRRWD
jgi:hypothetical protein